MSDVSVNTYPKYLANAGVGSWPIANTVTVYDGMLVGLEGGYANHWADGADDVFLGILGGGDVRIPSGPSTDQGKKIGATSDAIPPEARIDTSGATLRNLASVGGTPTQAKVGDPVYCATSNTDDMTLTIGAHKRAIGWLSRYRSATDVDVTLHPASKFAARAEMGGIISLTDNSGGTGTDTITVGAGEYTISFATTLVAITAAEGADLITDWPINHKFRILSMDWVTTIAGVGSSASHVLTVDIGATPVTSLALTITEASTSAIGELTAGVAGSAADAGAAGDLISVAVAAGTNFTGGEGFLLLKIQNMDTADAIASLADKINEILATE